MSQPGRNRIEELYEAQPREGVSTPRQTGSDQQGCLSESWPCFSGNAIDYLGFRISLYGLIDQSRGKHSDYDLLQIIMHNCLPDELRLKLSSCKSLAVFLEKLRDVVLSPEYVKKSFSEVIERWETVSPYDMGSELKFLQRVLKLERISRDGCLDKTFYSPHVFQLLLNKISDEMTDLLLLGTE